MVHGEAGVLVPGDNAVELTALSAEYTLRWDFQQKRQRQKLDHVAAALLNQLQAADNQKCQYRRKMLRPAAFSFQPVCLHAQEHRYLPINHKHRQCV